MFKNEEYKDVIYDIYLESLKNVHCNESNEKDACLVLFRAKGFKEMKEISWKNKEALRIVKELERLSEDDEFRIYYDACVIKWKEEGAKERELAIAKTS